MNYLTKDNIQWIVDILENYPKSFNVNIFCKSKESAEILEEMFMRKMIFEKFVKREDYRFFESGNKCLRIFIDRMERGRSRGIRSNIAIIDAAFSYQYVVEYIAPTANMRSHYESYIYTLPSIQEILEKD